MFFNITLLSLKSFSMLRIRIILMYSYEPFLALPQHTQALQMIHPLLIVNTLHSKYWSSPFFLPPDKTHFLKACDVFWFVYMHTLNIGTKMQLILQWGCFLRDAKYTCNGREKHSLLSKVSQINITFLVFIAIYIAHTYIHIHVFCRIQFFFRLLM